MSARCSLVVNGKSVRIATGDTPVEAALADGMIAPISGQGAAPAARRLGARSHRGEAARLDLPRPSSADASLLPRREAAPVPQVRRTGTLTQVRALGPRVFEVTVTLTRRLTYEPGHQVVVAFEGFEPLTASPTLRVDGAAELNELVFHLARDQHPVAEALADGMPLGHPVEVKGPVGRGHYRPGSGRLVLVASGTGFAPIWAIAHAARYIEPAREVVLIAGARDPLDLYMRPSLDWLRATGLARLVMVADRHRQRPPDVRPGPLTAHLPSLRATDVVHVAGDAATVGAVEVLAASVGARCYPASVGA
jgi:NAD(P)H-flavin reductase